MTGRTVITLVAALSVAAGCSGDPGDTVGSGPSVPDPPPITPPVATGPTDDLAPSQVTASTVSPPDTPPPCTLDALSMWTAQVQFVDAGVDGIVRIRNDSTAWCEVDVFASPFVDPVIEPDVWLQPGEWADLVIGADPRGGDGCATPTVVSLAPLDVNGASVVVPTAAVVPCDWWFTAFYVADPATEPCVADQLEALVVDDVAAVRNSSPSACELGEVVAVDGAETTARPSAAAPAVTALAAGDVAALALERPSGTSCSGGPATLSFESGAAVDVPGIGGCAAVTLGAPGPFFDGTDGPLRDVGDADDALTALDPFGDR